MADSASLMIGYVAETVWGVTPSGPPKLQTARFTSESIKANKTTEVSDEIRSDRQRSFIAQTGQSADGDIDIELSHATYDDFWVAMLMSAGFSVPVHVIDAGIVSAVAASNSFTHTTAWTHTPMANEWIKTSGFAVAANNGYFKVVSATTTTIVVSCGTLSDESLSPNVTISEMKQIVNGITEKSFVIEKKFTDLSNVYQYCNGMIPASHSLVFPAQGKVTGSFSFIGKKMTVATATIGDGAPTAATETTIMTVANDLKKVLIDGVVVNMVNGDIEIDNALAAVPVAGSVYAYDVRKGRFSIRGNLVLFFSDNAQLTKFLAHTEVSLAFVFEDAVGKGIIFDIPAAVLTTGTTPASGPDTDIQQSFAFEAFMDVDEDITFRIAETATI